MDFETLDRICDTVNPLMFLWVAALIIRLGWREGWRAGVLACGFLLAVLLVVYATRLVDNHFQLWPMFAADYSTHTAFVLAMAVCLFRLSGRWLPWLVVVLLYLVAMDYQHYHTWLDMISTALWCGAWFWLLHQRWPLKPAPAAATDPSHL